MSSRGGPDDRSKPNAGVEEWRGSLWNPFLDRLLKQEPPLGVEAMRLALALARLIFGFNETERGLGLDLVRRTARLDGRSLDRARDRLIERRLLEVEPGSPGRGKRTVWRLLRHPPEEVGSTKTSGEDIAERAAQTSAVSPAPERGRTLEAEEERSTSSTIVEELDRLDLTPAQRTEVHTHSPEFTRAWLKASDNRGVRSPAGVFMAGIRSGQPPSQESCALARAYVAEHGWPTGSRWVRGTHGGTYVQDALGRDLPPYTASWGRPSLEELQAALEADASGGSQ